MALHTYRTEMTFSFSDDADEPHRVHLTLKYRVECGAEATLEEPGYGPSVSIADAIITTRDGFTRPLDGWLWTFLEDDDALTAELLTHAAYMDDYAREQKADAEREERRLA